MNIVKYLLKAVPYVLVGGFAMLGQFVSDKSTEEIANKAATDAVVTVMNEREAAKEKANLNQ